MHNCRFVFHAMKGHKQPQGVTGSCAALLAAAQQAAHGMPCEAALGRLAAFPGLLSSYST